MEIFTTGTDDYGQYIKALICGGPGLGKTLFSSTAPNPFFASAEGGLMSIASRGIKGTKVHDSHRLTEVLMMASQSADVREKIVGAPVDTIVIDTLDEIARILVKERLDEGKKEQMAMGDWGWLGDQLRGLVRAFRNLDLHVIFTCHLRSTEDSETGRTYWKPAIPGAFGDEVAGYVDLALLLKAQPMVRNVDGESKRVTVRLLQTEPDLNHPWVKDRSGKLPTDLEINFRDDFPRIEKLIFGDPVGVAVEATKVIEGDLRLAVEVLEPTQSESPASPTQVESETPVSTSEATVQVDPASGPEQGPGIVTREQLKLMTSRQKMDLTDPAECEECGTVVEDGDQRDMGVVKYKMVMCRPCFRAAVSVRKEKQTKETNA